MRVGVGPMRSGASTPLVGVSLLLVLLRDWRRRSIRDPELVVDGGAVGLWKALAEVSRLRTVNSTLCDVEPRRFSGGRVRPLRRARQAS